MKTSRRVQTTEGTGRKNLPRLPKGKGNVTLGEVQEIRLKIQKMSTEKTQIRSKTNRMRQILHDRNAAIDHVFKESNEEKKIKTASDSTIAQLKENILGLRNTLESRQDDLKVLINSDRLALADELKQEIRIYHLEHKRLQKQSRAVKEGELIVTDELNRVKGELSERRLNKKAIDSIQEDLKSVIDKLVSYKRSELKIQNDTLAKYLVNHPKQAETKENQLNNEINQIYEDIDNIHQEIEEAEQHEKEVMEELQAIIDDQAAQIEKQIKIIKRRERQINGELIEEEEEDDIDKQYPRRNRDSDTESEKQKSQSTHEFQDVQDVTNENIRSAENEKSEFTTSEFQQSLEESSIANKRLNQPNSGFQDSFEDSQIQSQQKDDNDQTTKDESDKPPEENQPLAISGVMTNTLEKGPFLTNDNRPQPDEFK